MRSIAPALGGVVVASFEPLAAFAVATLISFQRTNQAGGWNSHVIRMIGAIIADKACFRGLPIFPETSRLLRIIERR